MILKVTKKNFVFAICCYFCNFSCVQILNIKELFLVKAEYLDFKIFLKEKYRN